MERMRSCGKKEERNQNVCIRIDSIREILFKNIFDGLLIYGVKSFDWI